MKKFRRHHFRRQLKRRPINVLASSITAFSLYWGLVSIFLTMREQYELAAGAIFLAIVCDMLDGTVARLTKSVSEFGKELDSLCDLVSFGVAPAMLIYHDYWREEQMAGAPEGRTGAIMAIFFVLCGALRLARYNVYQSGHRESFTGLPIPAAGGTAAAFVLFADYFHLHVAFWVLGPLTLALAGLMVSPVRYPKDRMKKAFVLAPRNAFRVLITAALGIAVFHYAITYSPAIVLFPICMAYVLFGIGDTAWTRLTTRRSPVVQPATAQSAAPVESPSSASEANTEDRL